MSDPDDTPDSLLRDTTARIFADLADPQTLNAAPDSAWKAPLWAALEDAGLTLAWVSEANGGAGATTLDGFEILRVSGHYAAPVAIAETLLAGRFLDAAGIKCPTGPLTVAPLRLGDQFTCARDGAISGSARAVPHIGDARAVVPVHANRWHPLVAVYRTDTRTLLSAAIESGERRVRAFAEACGPRLVGADAFVDVDPAMESLRNINTPEAFAAALETLRDKR